MHHLQTINIIVLVERCIYYENILRLDLQQLPLFKLPSHLKTLPNSLAFLPKVIRSGRGARERHSPCRGTGCSFLVYRFNVRLCLTHAHASLQRKLCFASAAVNFPNLHARALLHANADYSSLSPL